MSYLKTILVPSALVLALACATAVEVEGPGGEGGDGGSGSTGGVGGGSGTGATGGVGAAGAGTGGSGAVGTGGTGTGGTGVGGTGATGTGGTGTGGTGTGGTGTGGSGGSGAAGTGGTGVGGTGATGGDGGGRCAMKTKAAGGDGMIDDFADGDLSIFNKDARMGVWIATGGGTLKAENGALHFTSPAMGWASFTVAPAACYDATAYQGIKFKIWGTAGPNGVSFVTPTPPTVMPPVGTCPGTLGCDHFRYKVPMLPAAATEYSFTWSELKQAGWGDPAPGYNVAGNLIEIGFGGEDQAFAYDFYVDDIQFF